MPPRHAMQSHTHTVWLLLCIHCCSHLAAAAAVLLVSVVVLPVRAHGEAQPCRRCIVRVQLQFVVGVALDGLARRMVLAPPDFSMQHLALVAPDAWAIRHSLPAPGSGVASLTTS